MDTENKTLAYHRRYKQQHKEKYTKYARNYYATHKSQFKKYYETYKQKKQDIANGITINDNNEQLTPFQKTMMRYNRKLERLEAKKQAYIEQLAAEGWYE
jgi:hypothetical protein